ncbi:MAG TPA: hypothetical protein PKA37_00905 [Planctomycetota bacterium]|nr:hypothetical protein [Planctomycetota bacterium]
MPLKASLRRKSVPAEVHIRSYFSLETDLAAEFREWPEFRSGCDYDVELAAADSTVSICFVPRTDDESAFVRVLGADSGPLFDRALGRVVHALAAHSDDLMVDRIS